MIHKKSCFGRTFKQDSHASDPDGKSWSDDKFYENLRTKKETAQAQHGQGKKPSTMPSALNNAFKKLSDLNSGPDEDPDFWSKNEELFEKLNNDEDFDIINNPCYSSVPGNIFYTD